MPNTLTAQPTCPRVATYGRPYTRDEVLRMPLVRDALENLLQRYGGCPFPMPQAVVDETVAGLIALVRNLTIARRVKTVQPASDIVWPLFVEGVACFREGRPTPWARARRPPRSRARLRPVQ
jgi:hypothetical protein